MYNVVQKDLNTNQNIIQLSFDEGLFDSFPNKDQVFENSQVMVKHIFRLSMEKQYLVEMMNTICLVYNILPEKTF